GPEDGDSVISTRTAHAAAKRCSNPARRATRRLPAISSSHITHVDSAPDRGGAGALTERRGTDMRHPHIRTTVVLAASVFVVTVVLTAQSPDRFTLKAPNGIAFSEFKGYDAWTVLAVSHPTDADGCGTSKTGCIKAIVGNPVMVKAYSDGFPA